VCPCNISESSPSRADKKKQQLRAIRPRRKPGATSIIVTPMPAHRGTSRTYLLRKLRLAGRYDLAAAIEAGEAGAFEIAVALGWRKRPKRVGGGSDNEAKRRAFRLRALGL